MYKLLALDMDGTLLNSDHKVSERNKEFIEKAKEKGIRVVLLSGREPGSIKHFSDELGLDGLISGFNGGIITDNKVEEIYFNCCLDEGLARKTILMGQENMCSVVFLGDLLLVEDKNDLRYKTFEKYVIVPVKEVGKLYPYLEENKLWNKIHKVLISDENSILKSFKEKLETETENKMSLLFSLPFFLEAFNKNVSKGKALEEIGKIYNVKKEEIIAIGDGENDISMIQYAGLGIAMGNAPDKVKRVADYVTLSNNNDGVSHIIEKYILND